jgi:hypothetical protein
MPLEIRSLRNLAGGADERAMRVKPPPRRRHRLVRAVLVGVLAAYGLSVLAKVELRDAAAGTSPSLRWPSVPPWPKTEADGRLTTVVSRLAGRAAVARCWSSAGWKRRLARWHYAQGPRSEWRAFTVPLETPAVELSPSICTVLHRVERLRRPVWNERTVVPLVWSVAALSHESVHASGIPDEAKAECFGLQRIPLVARALGRTAAEGRYLARLYWELWYRFDSPPYTSNDCHDGGRLDLHPGSKVWP